MWIEWPEPLMYFIFTIHVPSGVAKGRPSYGRTCSRAIMQTTILKSSVKHAEIFRQTRSADGQDH